MCAHVVTLIRISIFVLDLWIFGDMAVIDVRLGSAGGCGARVLANVLTSFTFLGSGLAACIDRSFVSVENFVTRCPSQQLHYARVDRTDACDAADCVGQLIIKPCWLRTASPLAICSVDVAGYFASGASGVAAAAKAAGITSAKFKELFATLNAGLADKKNPAPALTVIPAVVAALGREAEPYYVPLLTAIFEHGQGAKEQIALAEAAAKAIIDNVSLFASPIILPIIFDKILPKEVGFSALLVDFGATSAPRLPTRQRLPAAALAWLPWPCSSLTGRMESSPLRAVFRPCRSGRPACWPCRCCRPCA